MSLEEPVALAAVRLLPAVVGAPYPLPLAARRESLPSAALETPLVPERQPVPAADKSSCKHSVNTPLSLRLSIISSANTPETIQHALEKGIVDFTGERDIRAMLAMKR